MQAHVLDVFLKSLGPRFKLQSAMRDLAPYAQALTTVLQGWPSIFF